MRFIQLKYFIRAAELCSIANAAAEFGVTPSVINGQIKKLEEELGCNLFIHTKNSLSLCESGRILYPYALKIMKTMDDGIRKIHDENNSLSYDINIATLALPTAIPFLMRGFKELYPMITPHISQYQEYNDTLRQKNDILIYCTEFPLIRENARILYHEPVSLAVSTQHPFAQYDSIEAKYLKNEHFILGSQFSDFSQIVNNYMSALNLTPEYTFISDYPPFIREMVANNIGVTFMPQLSWFFSGRKDIKLVRIKELEFARYIYIEWNDSEYIPKAVRHFIDYTLDTFDGIKKTFDAVHTQSDASSDTGK